MHRMVALISLFGMAAIAPDTSAQSGNKSAASAKTPGSNARLEIKGLYIGMPFDELQATYPGFAAVCSAPKNGGGFCHQYSIISRPAKRMIPLIGYAKGVDGERSLQSIGNNCPVLELKAELDATQAIDAFHFLVPEFCFADLVSAFSSKYKRAKSDTKAKVSTKGGAEYWDQTITWEAGTSRLQMNRFFVDVETSYLGMSNIASSASKSKAAAERRDKNI